MAVRKDPRCPAGLTADGQRAWKVWLGSWWAAFYTPDDLPGLELAVKIYDGVCAGHIDIGKAVPILDRYGITPKGRQDLRWAERPSAKPAPAVEPSDEIAAETRNQKGESGLMPVTRLVPPTDWPTLGWTVIDWTETYLCHGPGDIQGEPLVWDDEWAQIILDAYRVFPKGHPNAGNRCVSYFGVSMPKGRAKSEFAGAIVCAELCGPVRFDGWDANGDPIGRPVTYPFIRPLATEEGQTGNTYGNVQAMLEHAREHFPDEWNFGQLDIGSTRTLVGKGGRNGEIRPSTAGAASKDGGKESFAVADEPHLYFLPELRQMHAMVRRNARKRKIAQPWMLATTTMFQPGQMSVAEDLYDEAEKVAGKPRKSFGFAWHHREGSITDADWDDDSAQLVSLTEAYGPAAGWMDLAGMIEHEIRAPGSVEAENARYFHNIRWKGENRAIDS